MKTSGSGGNKLKKKVTVHTDDPKNKKIPLTITGQVLGLYTLSAKSVRLTGVVGEKIQETIHLVPSRESPFTVKEVSAKKGENIRFELEEVKGAEGIEYELTVENIATEAGVYFDTLYLKTDSKIKPRISISVVGRIKAAETKTTGKK